MAHSCHTGAARSLAEHPFKILYQEKFRVTLNTDNRLMSDTSMTKEFEAARDAFVYPTLTNLFIVDEKSGSAPLSDAAPVVLAVNANARGAG